jgi:hypothetical protein
MAKSNFLQNSFVSGELSEIIKGRTDLDQYYKGLETAENVVTIPQGGVKRRPGFKFAANPTPVVERYTAPNPTTPNGGTPANVNDDDPTTYSVTTTAVGTTDDYVVVQYDIYGNQEIEYIDLINIKLTSGTSTEFVIESQVEGGAWETSATVPTLTSYEQTFRLNVDKNARNWRLIRKGTTDLGTAQVSLAEMNLYRETGGFNSAMKLHKFEISLADSFLLLFTPDNLRIYRVTESATTFMQDLNHGLGYNFPTRVASNENVLLMFNENEAPRRLVYNLNGNGQFWYDTPTFLNIPKFDFNDALSPTPISAVQVMTFQSAAEAGDRYQVDIEGVVSKNITYAGDATVQEQLATAENLRRNLQEMPIFGETGISVVRTHNHTYQITIAGESADTFNLFSAFKTSGTENKITFTISAAGSPRKEDVWSATRGYPKNGVFAGGRLWFGGTRDKPQSLFGSRSGSFLDFKTEESEDDEGIFVTLNGAKSDIIDISGGRGLQVFTEGAEFNVTGNTPATIDVVQQSQHGSFSVNCPTTSLDGATLFVDANGRSLRQYVFNFNEDAFRSADVSVLASQLINKPVDMDVVTSTTSEDANYVFIINQDGTAVVLNMLREQDINGFTRFNQIRPDQSQDLFKQCVSVNNVLFVITEHSPSVRTINQMTFDHLMDSSVKFNAPHGTTLSGLDHLAGDTVQIVAGYSVLPERTVNSSGEITLSAGEAALTDTIEVGLNFPVTVQSMPLNTAGPRGNQNVLNQKRVDSMNLRVINSAGIYIDGNPVAVRSFGDAGNSPLNSSLVPSTGIIEDNNGGNGWSRQVAPKITLPDPTPFHLQAIDYEVSSS